MVSNAPRSALADLLRPYVPADRVAAMAEGRDLPGRAFGAVLFADIAGFTELTLVLEREYGVRRGGEALTHHINTVYGVLIAEVDRCGGSVIGFSGDAITCWFDRDDGTRASGCALRLQVAMNTVESVQTPSGGRASFTIKVAVTSGNVRRFVVGDPRLQVMDVLTGDVLDRMSEAERLTDRGEVLVGGEVAAAAGQRATIRAWRAGGASRFAVLGAMRDGEGDSGECRRPPVETPQATRLRPWVLPHVYARLEGGHGDFLAELRPAVALFLRFSGLDFEGDDLVSRKLDAYVRWTQQVLERYEGALIQLTTGDKGSYLYAAFGAPVAQEGMVDHAISAALALRAPPPELAFVTETQIGISTGRMRTGAYGSELRRTYGVLGDETNVAARLMMKASAGQILASQRVVEGSVGYRFDPIGTAVLKGKGPMPLFELVGRMAAPEPATESTRLRDPIVGRQRECALLHSLVDQLKESAASTVVVVEGEAGIGKSRLVDDVVQYARTKRAPALRCVLAAGDAVERATPYYAWRAPFARLLGIDGLTDPDAIRAQLARTVPPALAPLSPLLAPVIAIDLAETGATAQLSGNIRAAQVLRFLADLFRALSGAVPLLFTLEDAHWLDSSSWALLERVRGQVRCLLLVLTTRPQDAPGESYQRLARSPMTRVLRLDAMSGDDTTHIVSRRLGVDTLPDDVAALIADKAEGNPFFAEELAFALRDAGLIRVDGGVCHVEPGFEAVHFPDTIEGVVTSRMDRLPPSEQLTLKIASVVGRSFKCGTIRDLFPLEDERPSVPGFLAHLAGRGLTVRERDGDDEAYVFKHAVTVEVAYNLLLFEQRRALHGAVADWYERAHGHELSRVYAVMAHHRTRAIEGQTQPEPSEVTRALTALTRAAKHALETGATAETVTHARTGQSLLAFLPESRERSLAALELHSVLGAALVVVLGPTHEDVRREFDRARQLCLDLGETSRLFEALFGTWYSHLTSSDRVGAIEFSRQLLELALIGSDPVLESLARQACGVTSVFNGDHAVGLHHMQRALSLAERATASGDALAQARNPVVMTHAYCACARWFLGSPERAHGEARTAIELAGAVAHPLTLTQALCFGAIIERFRRNAAAAATLIGRAHALATEHRFPFWLGVTSSVLGWIAIEGGDLEGGIEQIEAGMARDREAGVFPLTFILALTDLLDAFTRLGRIDEAVAIVDDARTTAATRLTGFCAPEMHRLEGALWLRRGDSARADACVQRALETARAQEARSWELRAAMTRHRFFELRGRRPDSTLQDTYDAFEEGHDTGDLLEAKAMLERGAIG